MKKFSIIIPVYNSEKTIKKCLDAIYGQTYKNFEVIVVNDCGTDKTADIVKSYNCKLLTLDKNSGPAVARNFGAKKASGEILLFIDSDIALKKDVLERILKNFEEKKDVVAVVGVYAKEPLIRDSLVEEYRTLQEHYWKSSSSGYISSMILSIGAIKKNVFFEFSGLDERYRKADVEDIEFGNRITEKYKIFMDKDIQGYHDSDDDLKIIMKNFAKRATQRVNLFMKRKKFDSQYATANRGFGVLSIVPGVVLLLLGFYKLYFIIPGLLLVIMFLFFDKGLYMFILREKGPLFLIYFVLIHTLLQFSIFYGLLRGFIKYFLNNKKMGF